MQTVNDLMTIYPMTVAPDTPLEVVWTMMEGEGVRQLPVVEGNKLVGIITERDVRLVLRSELFDIGSAEMVMTENPITVTPTTPIYRAAEMLRAYKFGALPVVDEGNLVGIISVSDFLDRTIAEEVPEEETQLPADGSADTTIAHNFARGKW
jgi:acetoin utilization protein AcuB